MPGRPSLAYDQILEAVDDGRIKGLWIICTNPLTPGPIRTTCSECCERRSSWWSRTCSPPPRRPSWPTCAPGRRLWGEGRHLHQLRDDGSASCAGCGPARAGLAGPARSSKGSPSAGAAAGCSRVDARRRRSSQVMKEAFQGTPCDFSGIDGLRQALERLRRRTMAVPGGAAPSGRSGVCSRTAIFFTRTEGAVHLRGSGRAAGDSRTPRISLRASDRQRLGHAMAHPHSDRQSSGPQEGVSGSGLRGDEPPGRRGPGGGGRWLGTSARGGDRPR